MNSTLGMPIHRWLITDGGRARYFAPASNSRVNRERESGASQSPRFSQIRSEMRLRLFLQKEMKRSAHFSNFELRLYLPALFSANFQKGIFF